MEEDIKILETFRYRQKTKNYNKITLEDIQAIENLIARNKELESSLEKYEKIIKDNTIIVKDESGDYQELNINIADYISKSKIKEVIQRIDYDVKKTREVKTEKNNGYYSNDYDRVRLKAYITKSNEIKRRLQELLNKGG